LELTFEYFSKRFAQSEIPAKEIGGQQEPKPDLTGNEIQFWPEPACEQTKPAKGREYDFSTPAQKTIKDIVMGVIMAVIFSVITASGFT